LFADPARTKFANPDFRVDNVSKLLDSGLPHPE
jgi:hypothetical protein